MKPIQPGGRRGRSALNGPCLLVAITGGSGSGKTWLAEKLEAALAPRAARLSLDDFYRDRSHLALAKRARLNFDQPGAIDWPKLECALLALRQGHRARVPCYDFTTHARLVRTKTLDPKPVILVEGLWLLRRPSIRSYFALRIFVDCPRALRLRRRLARDTLSRGRSRASVLKQFRETVDPMHQRYVTPQARYADVILAADCRGPQIRKLAGLINLCAGGKPPPEEVSCAGRRIGVGL